MTVKKKVSKQVKRWRREPLCGSIESPTWGQVQVLASSVLELLGGSPGASKQLNWESFGTLAILASLKLSKEKADLPIFGKPFVIAGLERDDG